MIPIRSGYLATSPIGGPQCESFERELESHYDVAHARVLNSATSALHAALVAVGVRRGDEIICPAYSMSGTAAAIVHAGATPIFTDIADNYCLDWEDVRSRITDNTSAIMLVHLFGHHATVPDWTAQFAVVHDAAQAPTLRPDRNLDRHIWVYSLNQHKIINCGEGGYALTYSRGMADRIHAVRNHGECFTDDIIGHNYRMTEMQAVIGREELAVLEKRMKARREWAASFGVKHGIRDIDNRDWFLYPARCEPAERGNLARRIGGREGYHVPLYRLPYFFAAHAYSCQMLPNTEKIESEIVVVDPACQ